MGDFCNKSSTFAAIKTEHMKLYLLKRGIYIAILTIIFSCQGEESSLEKDMYLKLQSIKTADKANEQIAQYDSLVLSLVDYYEHRGSKLKLAKAYYYAGRVFYEQRDFPKSLHYYNKAASVLPDSDTPELEGPIYSQIGYVFSLQDLSEDAISAFNHSYLSYKRQKDTLGMIYGLRDMGKELSDHDRYEEAKEKLLEAIQLAKVKGIDYMYYGNKSNLANLYCKLHDYPKARAEIGEALSCVYDPDRSGVYSTAANIYMKLGMVDSAEYYSKQLLDIGTIYARHSANERLAEIALKREQAKEAVHFMKAYKELNDSINETTKTETVAKINALYNYQRQEQENAELRESNQRANFRLTIAIFIILILVLIFIISYFYYRKQKETKGLKSELSEQFKKWQQTQEREAETEEKQKMMQECDIYKKFHNFVDNGENMPPKITADDWKELEQAVNSIYPRFSERLINLCDITTSERQVCLLRKINMSPTRIAIILNKSKQAVNSIRERLYKKAFDQKGTPAQWDDYLQSF